MKRRCIIVDDEPIARQIIEQYVEDDGRLEVVARCKNALEAMRFLQQNEVDVVFLDINMPKLTGLEMLSVLEHKPTVIFTTAYREYAVEGFELEALDYLIKPFSFQRFVQSINRLIARNNSNHIPTKADFFFVKAEGRNVKVQYQDMLYIEAMSEYIRIHTTDKSVVVLQSLRNMEEKLPKDAFLRVHRSFIVALDKIEAIEGNQILIGTAKIPVSKSYRDALSKLISQYNL